MKTRSNKKINRRVNEVVNNYNKFEKLMEGSKLKKNIRLYRYQRKLYISEEDLAKGETIIHGSRSFSISEEGAKDFVGKSKSYIWEVELEAPVGTDAFYIAPKAKSQKYDDKFISQMETIVKDETRCKIIEVINEENVHKVVLRAIV